MLILPKKRISKRKTEKKTLNVLCLLFLHWIIRLFHPNWIHELCVNWVQPSLSPLVFHIIGFGDSISQMNGMESEIRKKKRNSFVSNHWNFEIRIAWICLTFYNNKSLIGFGITNFRVVFIIFSTHGDLEFLMIFALDVCVLNDQRLNHIFFLLFCFFFSSFSSINFLEFLNYSSVGYLFFFLFPFANKTFWWSFCVMSEFSIFHWNLKILKVVNSWNINYQEFNQIQCRLVEYIKKSRSENREPNADSQKPRVQTEIERTNNKFILSSALHSELVCVCVFARDHDMLLLLLLRTHARNFCTLSSWRLSIEYVSVWRTATFQDHSCILNTHTIEICITMYTGGEFLKLTNRNLKIALKTLKRLDKFTVWNW